jgi:dGTP triphosphohydrolase
MKDITDNMNDILGIEGELIEYEEVKTPAVIESNGQEKDVEHDYQYVRQNLHDIIDKGSMSLDALLELAKASEHPRAFEVVGQLTKTLVDANKDLIEVQRKIKELKKDTVERESAKNVTNNNLFVGSTADLLKALRNKEDDDVRVQGESDEGS